jgi:hypothetical protein
VPPGRNLRREITGAVEVDRVGLAVEAAARGSLGQTARVVLLDGVAGGGARRIATPASDIKIAERVKLHAFAEA